MKSHSAVTAHHALVRSVRGAVAGFALLTAFVVAAPMAGASGATVYYVEANGSGTTCTELAPCSSITTALNLAQSNGAVGVVEVGAGNFSEDVTVPNGRYTIAGIPGETNLTAEEYGFSNQNATVTISGFNIYTGGVLDVANYATMTLDDDVFTGSGVANYATMTISNSTLSGETIGVYNNGTLLIDSSTLTNNGSGLFNDTGGVATIVNSTLADNSEDGVASAGTSVAISSSTLSGNGDYDINNTGGGTVSTFGSIIDNNDGGTCNTAVTSDGGYNIESSNTCGFQSFYGDLVNTAANEGVLQDNGGPTYTEAILPTSAAHNLVPQASCLALDQRGETRPNGAGSGFCDAGSYQYAAPTSAAIISSPLVGVTSFSPNLGPVTVQMYDAEGFPAVSAHSVVLNLSSNSPNGFFSVANAGVSTNAVVIPAGQTSTGFFLGSLTPTSMLLTITIAKLGTLTQTETIDHGPPFYATITAGNNQSAIVGQPLATALSVQITDAQGNTFAGSDVTFAITSGVATFDGGSSTADVDTDANGNVTAPIVEVGEQPSNIVITATDGAATTTFNETGLTGPPDAISFIAGDGQSVLPDTAFPTDLEVQVVDLYGNPVDSATVDFSVVSGSANLASPTGTTDINGDASVGLTSGPVSGPVSVSATVDGTSITASTTGLVVTPDVPANIAVNGGNNQTTEAGTDFTDPLSVLVTDQYGNPTPGVTVDFAVTSSASTFDTGAAPSTESMVTNASGIATSDSVTADTVAGPATITATVDGTAITTTFNETIVPGPPSIITTTDGNNQSTAAGTDFTDPLSVSVTDQYGNPIEGLTIDFDSSTGGSTFDTGSAPSTESQVTNAGGIATSDSVTAGTVAGPATITATVDGTAITTTFDETVVPGPPANIAINAGSGQTTAAGTDFADPLSVLVTDQYGNPTPGVTVDFAVTDSASTFDTGAAPSTESMVTNASGIATSDSVTADTVAGPATITATVDGTAITTTFDETIAPGPPATLTINSGSNQSATSDHVFGTALSTTVADQYGNVITGATVTYRVTSGSANFSHASSQSHVTVNGVTHSAGFAAGDHAGTEVVTATVQGTTVTVNFTGITITPPKSTVRIASFALGSSTMTTSLNAQVSKLAASIAKYGNTKVALTGYTDGTGGDKSNKLLSVQRADAVKSYLVKLLVAAHVKGVTITTVGKGATNFINGNPTLALNRRVEAAVS